MGKPVPEVAEGLGIGPSILSGWVRREVAKLKLGNNVLKKAAVILRPRAQPGAAR